MSGDPDPPGLYGRLARFSARHRVVVLAVAAVVAILAALLGLPPRVDSDLKALLPQDLPLIQDVQALEAEEGGLSFLVVAFRDPRPEASRDPAAFDAFTARVADRLTALDGVAHTLHTQDPDLTFRVGLLQLPPSDVAALDERLRGALLMGRSLNPVVTQRLLKLGPVAERLTAAGDGVALLADDDDASRRILVRPTGPTTDLPYARTLMAELDAVVDEETAASPYELVWIGGPHRHVVEDAQGLEADLALSSAVSLALVLLLLGVALRSVKAVGMVMAPLLVANVVMLAFVAVWAGALNAFTAMALPVLFGLGIDFAIHLLGRYRELRADGLDVEDALAAAWDRTGPPCTTAGLTSAGGFLALVPARFLGFSHLGVVLAVGLLLCLMAMLVLLPALIPLLDPNPRPPLARPDPAGPSRPSTYRLAPLGLGGLVVATVLLGGFAIPRLGFEYDTSSLRREGLAYAELAPEARAVVQDAFSPTVVTYPSREALARAHRRIEDAIAAGETDRVARVLSVETVLPVDQPARIDALQALSATLQDPGLRYLHASAARPVVDALLPLRDHAVRPLASEDLPTPLLDLLGAGSADRHRLLILPRGNTWDMRNSLALYEEVRDLAPERPVAGMNVVGGNVMRVVFDDLPLVGGLALLLVALLVSIDLRKPAWVAAALGVLLAGGAWAAGILWLADVPLTLINLAGIPVLLGIGVDGVIHLQHRVVEEGPGGLRRALRTTGVAAGLSTLTTMASFVALTVAGSRGFQSFGWLVVLGLCAITASTAVVLPLVYAAGWRLTGRHPSAGVEDDPDQ